MFLAELNTPRLDAPRHLAYPRAHRPHHGGGAVHARHRRADLPPSARPAAVRRAAPVRRLGRDAAGAPSGSALRAAAPGRSSRVGGFDFDVRFTPGHSPGSVSFLGQGMVFGGDVLFNGSVGRTDLPGRRRGDSHGQHPVGVPLVARLDRGAQRPWPRHHDRGRAAHQSVSDRGVSAWVGGSGERGKRGNASRHTEGPSDRSLAYPPTRSRTAYLQPLRLPGPRRRPGAARIPAPTAAPSTRSGTALTDRAVWTIPDLDVFSGLDARSSLDISRSVLPARFGPGALGVLDISEFFGETTGGVRTYLLQKARYVESRPELRQVLVVPGARDSIHETGGVRCYRLHGPSIPTQKPYRFMLATRVHQPNRGLTSAPN